MGHHQPLPLAKVVVETRVTSKTQREKGKEFDDSRNDDGNYDKRRTSQSHRIALIFSLMKDCLDM